MDISSMYRTIAPLGRARDRAPVPPVKATQDRNRRNRKKRHQSNFGDDVVVTLSGKSPKADGENA